MYVPSRGFLLIKLIVLCVVAPVANFSLLRLPILNGTVTLNAVDYLNCSAVGSPTPIITIKHNDDILRLYQTNNTVILKLSERKSDNGSYCCKASNALGSNETCITVIVHGSDSQWQDISVYSGIAVGSGLLVLLILSTIIAHVKKKSRERLVYFFARVYFVIDLFT